MTSPFRRLVAGGALIALGACSSSSGPSGSHLPVPAAVLVIPDSATLEIGDSVRFTASVIDSAGHAISAAPITFASSDSAVASVTDSGEAVGHVAGSATISVSSGTLTAHVPVHVLTRRIVVTPDSATLTVGDSLQLVAGVVDGANHHLTGFTFAFASADTSIATVTAAGKVVVRGLGKVLITVTSDSMTAHVTIVAVTRALVVTPDSASLAIGDTLPLTAVVDSDGHAVIGSSFAFASSDTAVAQVSGLGLVTGHGHGTATVTVTSGALSAQVKIVIAGSRLLISGRPFGVAVSSLGLAYVTQQDANALTGVIVGADTVSEVVDVGADPGDVAFNGAGSVAYVTNFLGNTVGRVSVGSGSQSDSAGVGGDAFHIRVSGNGARIYVASGDGYLYTLDATTLGRIDSVAIDNDPNGLAIKGDTIAYVSSSSMARVTELSLVGDSVLRHFAVGDTPQDVVLSADGGTLYAANQAGRVDVIDLGSGTIGTPMAVSGAFGLARTPAGDTLVVSSLGGQVYRIDAATRAVLRTYSVGGTPRRVAIAPDGAILAANEGGWLDIIR